ncbi:MAG: hypothetical protein Q7S87_17985 [Agitococcus sp.]|nr:hypothetical protein [Agitococcus sp.]
MKTTQSFAGSCSLKSIFFVLACFWALAGCSDPRNYPVTKLTEAQSKELGQKLTSEEGQKLASWTLRSALSDKASVEGVTVAQALKQQDAWVIKQQEEAVVAAELKKKVEAARKQKQDEFSKLLTVALVNKKSSMGEYGKRWVGLEVAYDNKSDRDIQGVKGMLRITDIFGDKIMNIRWSFDKGIMAKQNATEKNTGVDINQFIDEQMKLYITDFDKLKSTFEVSTIIFKDGSKMDAPD